MCQETAAPARLHSAVRTLEKAYCSCYIPPIQTDSVMCLWFCSGSGTQEVIEQRARSAPLWLGWVTVVEQRFKWEWLHCTFTSAAVQHTCFHLSELSVEWGYTHRLDLFSLSCGWLSEPCYTIALVFLKYVDKRFLGCCSGLFVSMLLRGY